MIEKTQQSPPNEQRRSSSCKRGGFSLYRRHNEGIEAVSGSDLFIGALPLAFV